MVEETIMKAVEGSKEFVKPEPGDYIQDGLLYCGKCRTPKQIRVQIVNLTIEPYTPCKCQKERQAAAEAEAKRREFAEWVRKNRRECFPEGKLETWTFENDDGSNSKYIAAMKRYVANFEDFLEKGKGVILYGPTGHGKTYLAAATANAVIDRGDKAIFTSLSRATATMESKWGGREEYINLLSRVPLVVIDDFGTERDTKYMQEIVYDVINARYTAGLPLIVTTNLTLEQLARPESVNEQRIYDRLLEMCYPIEVKGRNKRKDKMMDTYAPMRDILGV